MKSATILLVDDDAFARTFLKRCLCQIEAYRVLEASSGKEAHLVCAGFSERIDLLVSDVNLRDQSGQDLARELSGQRPEMQVLFLSGNSGSDLVDRGLLNRRDAFLQKPFRPALLLQLVSAMLDDEEIGIGKAAIQSS